MSLFKKYNVPGPRYTSYPTVPYWDQSPSSEQYIASVSQALEEAEVTETGAAIYAHIPFCQALCTYCGCNNRITRNKAVGLPYVETLLKEWGMYLDRLGRKQLRVSEIHLGGGTPTFLSVDELSRLMEGLLNHVQKTPDAEFSIEVDPRVTSREQLKVLSQFGFNRISLGVQDFDPKVQDIVHRVQSEEQVRDVTETARELGYHSVNFDLIYGLPFQTQASVKGTIEAVQRLRPDRIAFYSYAHVPWIRPSQRRFTEADLPSGDEKRSLYEMGREMLEGVGYREVGMDHFALESDAMWKSSKDGSLHRNFMGYTTRHVSPQLGLGVSAIGDSWRQFAQNEKLLERYQEMVAAGQLPIMRGHILNAEDLVLRRHVLNVMTRFETEWSSPDLQSEHLSTLRERLSEPAADGLVEFTLNGLRITDAGRPFLRNICMAFDARLCRKAPETKVFSQTV